MTTASPGISSNIPKQDYLSLFEGSHPKFQDVISFIDFKKDDIAKATGIPMASIRYDAKMPADLEARIREWGTLLNLVAEHFDGSPDKTALWFTMPNPMLGDIAPRDMIRFGRFRKLLKFILNSIDENQA